MKGTGSVFRTRNVRRKNVNEVNIPEALNYETAFKLYKLDKAECNLHSVPNPKTQNCRDNPYCLGRLGQQKWDKEKQQIDKEGKATAKSFARRDVTKVPCGLVNLGNSCYLNSFIQIYFSDPFFRRLIYSWHPVENFVVPPEEKVNIEELMLCLQRLFVTLQVTPYEDANAEHLAKLLQLDSEQHDALEFQILLFNKIEKLLSSREEWREVKDAIVNRAKGVITQRISCPCGRESVSEVPFHPFILGIEKVNTLSKALEAYFSPEQLPDYVCPSCKTPDVTVRKFTIKELPPVLTIQVNRFTFDAAGRKKKVRSALQYLRDMELDGVMYENCAVMVHEGPNADCGHYYDIIKHPDTGKWFTYNDEVVKPTTAPGVVAEKERISKTTPDMKGCYALIYRRKNDTDNDVPEPPQHLKEEISAALDAEFLADKMEANGSSKKSHDLMDGRHNFLLKLWENLQVKTGENVKKNPGSTVFLPTQLLADVQSKEFDVFVKLKENASNEKKNRQNPGSRGDGRSASGYNSLAKIVLPQRFFQLCQHGRLSLESVSKGELKAVKRGGAEELLKHYGLNVTYSDGSDLGLKTGKDVCLECIANKKAEVEFMVLVDSKEKFAKQLLKEKSQRFYHADDCVWISTRSLAQYRKLAIRAYRQRCSANMERVEVMFGEPGEKVLGEPSEKKVDAAPSSSEVLVANNVADVKPGATSEACASVPSTSGLQWPGEKMEPPDSKCFLQFESDTGKASFSGKLSCEGDIGHVVTNGELVHAAPHSTAAEKIAECCGTAVKKRKLVDGTAMENGIAKAHEQVARTNGILPFIKSEIEEALDLESGIDVDEVTVKPPDNCSDEAMSCENGTNTDSANDMDLGTKGSKEDDEDEDFSDSEDIVVFNGDLRCDHGGFDYKCYETKERRVVAEKWEWDQLVDGAFASDQVYQVITDETPCAACEELLKNKKDTNEGQQRRLQEIRTEIGELIRIVSRRMSHQIMESQYTRVICADFIRNMLSRFKSGTKVVTIPSLCQDCLLCQEHKLPYLFFDVERKAFPVTLDEWKRIVTAMQADKEEATEIPVQNGEYKIFCDPCRRIQQEIDDHKRFVYEKGADIYVKLKNDENEEPHGENGDAATSALAAGRPVPATRRAAAKNCMKFKMTSMNTVLELKVKIYEKTGQSPSDQLLYHNDRLLYDSETLETARIDPKELIDAPLTLITQSISDSADVSRELEKGFANTALSHW